jgi:hypothetical protein
VIVEPLNAESSARGLVLSRLRAAGVPDAVVSTVELALLIRLGEATGADVAASAQTIAALSEAVRAGVDTRDRALAALGASFDPATLRAGLGAAVQGYARKRHDGTSSGDAQRELAAAFVAGLRAAGADAEQAALSTAAAALALDGALALANPQARLDIARAAVSLNLNAREELLASLPSSNARERAAAGLAEARARAEAAGSLSAFRSALAQSAAETEAAVRAELLQQVLSRLGNVPADVRIRVEARLSDAFAQANLATTAGVNGSSAEIAAAVARFRTEVRAAVAALVEAAPGAGVDAEATARLLVVVKGGPFAS